MKRRREITFETEKIVIRGELPEITWCDACAARVPMFPPERAALLINTTPREIYRRVEKGELHFVETSRGDLFICCRSLQQTIEDS